MIQNKPCTTLRSEIYTKLTYLISVEEYYNSVPIKNIIPTIHLFYISYKVYPMLLLLFLSIQYVYILINLYIMFYTIFKA